MRRFDCTPDRFVVIKVNKSDRFLCETISIYPPPAFEQRVAFY